MVEADSFLTDDRWQLDALLPLRRFAWRPKDLSSRAACRQAAF